MLLQSVYTHVHVHVLLVVSGGSKPCFIALAVRQVFAGNEVADSHRTTAFWFTLVRQVFAGNEVAYESNVTEPQAFWLTVCI